MKLEIGMYVRYKRGGMGYIDPADKIGKIINQVNDSDIYELDNNNCIFENDVVKASFNIIDLIEEQDLVEIEFYSQRRKKRITRLFEVDFIYDNDITFDNAHCQLNIIGGSWSNADKRLKPVFKSVVTKEQFEDMKYRIGDKTNDKKRNISKNKKS